MNKTCAKKVLAITIILLFISVSVISSTGTTLEKSSITSFGGKTLYVGGDGPGNYSKIQDAIDNASDGDTVFVFDNSSPYYENVVVDKPINLVGENKLTTVIDGSGSGDVIYISVNRVNISGFTICNAGDGFAEAGIKINSSYNTIQRNIITNNDWNALRIEDGHYNIIINNELVDNLETCIEFVNGDNNIVSENKISVNGLGMRLLWSSDNLISKNIFSDSIDYAIWLDIGEGNKIVGNIICNNFKGIDHTVNGCTITGNLFSNHTSIAIELEGDNNLISENTFKNNGQGISLASRCMGNQILYNNFINNNYSADAGDIFENIWDDGERGNYWDDYTGEDKNQDNIGDTPYQIVEWADDKDNFPFMTPYPYDQNLPTLEITKPQRATYIGNRLLRHRYLRIAFIIGDIDIEVNAMDDSGIHRVEFHIDGKLLYTDREAPYNYSWSKDRIRLFHHFHIIKAVAYDYAGKKATDKIMVWKFF